MGKTKSETKQNKALIALVELFEQVAEEKGVTYDELLTSMKGGGW